jgi:hypothetical protein
VFQARDAGTNFATAYRALQVDFKIASKGGGETHLSARFGPQDFQTLIQAMLVADRQAALDAMAEELAHHRNS